VVSQCRCWWQYLNCGVGGVRIVGVGVVLV
jgi:hypothetical protein